jgi:hypothetical protein
MNGNWSGNNFLLDSSSLANHSGLAQLLFSVPTYLLLLLRVGSKNSPLQCIIHKPSTHILVTFLPSYSPTIKDLLLIEWGTKVKPDTKSDEIHPQVSHNGHPGSWCAGGCSLLAHSGPPYGIQGWGVKWGVPGGLE